VETFQRLSEKTIFTEIPNMTKEEKQEMIERFKSYHKKGAVLTGVAAGSFGEGIDLPGDFLRCVVIVGLPLQVPDLEIKELIEYYDRKFGKGWDYGYTLPAITRSLQNAGRCIRSETDKGVIIFLEERFASPRYKKCFPKEWNIIVSTDFQKRIKDFFNPASS
jgi:DNA excision repair protein ERCC-2